MPSALQPKSGKLSRGLQLKRKYLLRNLGSVDSGAPSVAGKRRKRDESDDAELAREQYGPKLDRAESLSSKELNDRTTDADTYVSHNLKRTMLNNLITKPRTHYAESYRKQTESSDPTRFEVDNRRSPRPPVQSSIGSNVHSEKLEQCLAYVDIAHELNPHYDGDSEAVQVPFPHSPTGFDTPAYKTNTRNGTQRDDVATRNKEEVDVRWKGKGRNTVRPQRKREIQAEFMRPLPKALVSEAANDVGLSVSTSATERTRIPEPRDILARKGFNPSTDLTAIETHEDHSNNHFQRIPGGHSLETAELYTGDPGYGENRAGIGQMPVYGIPSEPRSRGDGQLICPHCEQRHDIASFEEHVSHCEARHVGKLKKRDLSKPKSRCWKCNRSFSNANGPFSELDLHVAQCPKKVCSRCQKKNIDAADIDAHFAGCTLRKHGGCGNPVRGDRYDAHVKTCPWTYCSKCQRSRIPVSDLQRHQQLCRIRTHVACSGHFHESVFDDHVKKCPWRYCARCGKNRISVEDHLRHVDSCPHYTCVGCGKTGASGEHDCGLTKCRTCWSSVPTGDYPAHKRSCIDKLHVKRSGLRKDQCSFLPHLRSESCSKVRRHGFEVCKEHAEKRDLALRKNSANEKHSIRPTLSRSGSPAMKKVLLKMRGLRSGSAISKLLRIWREEPERLLICDTEGNIHQSPRTSTATFQITIRNGKGEIVVPRTTVNHGITKAELFERSGASGHFVVRGCFAKFYGSPTTEVATGGTGVHSATWKEIAGTIKQYIGKHELDKSSPFVGFVDWSSSNVDYCSLKAGLDSVQEGSLLPPCPAAGSVHTNLNPLQWWRMLRKLLKLDKEPKLQLTLVNLFSILEPDELWLEAHAHDSDADVQMLHKILQYTLDIWLLIEGYEGPIVDQMAVPGCDTISADAIEKEETNNLAEVEREDCDMAGYDDYA
jgi:hypothetical protein